MSFGRRLALFFVLIVLVPTLALVGMLLIVSEDSRQGKADARLAAGLDTALALYDERVQAAEPVARRLAADPQLAEGLRSGDRAALRSFAEEAVRRPGVEAAQVLGPADTPEAAAGGEGAIAFASLDLEEGNARRGKLLVSVTSANEFAAPGRGGERCDANAGGLANHLRALRLVGADFAEEGHRFDFGFDGIERVACGSDRVHGGKLRAGRDGLTRGFGARRFKPRGGFARVRLHAPAGLD